MEILKIVSKLNKKVVIGTTGFNSRQENLIKIFEKNSNIKGWQHSLG